MRMTNGAVAVIAGVAISAFSTLSVSAASWVGAAGSFTNGANWDTGLVPTNGVSASVDNGGTAQFDGGGASLATLALGNVWGTSGALAMSAGALTNTYFFVGNYGAGNATQSGGDIVVTVASADPACGIGTLTNGVGSYTMSGGSLTLSGADGNLQIGGRGTGAFTQTGGAVTGNNWMVIGRYGPAGNGALTVSGGEFCQNDPANALIVAEGGVGRLTVTNTGKLSLNGGLRVGMLKNTPPIDVGTGTGTVWLCQGGTLSTPLVHTLGGSSTFNFDGGLLSARGSQQSFGSFFQGLSAAYVRGGGAVVDSGNNLVTVNQSLLDGGGAGGLTKLGAGILSLGGANSYAGNTLVSNGVLTALVPGALPGYSEAGRVTVCDGAGLTVGVGAAGQWDETAVAALVTSGALGAGSQFGFDTARASVTVDADLTGLGDFGLLKTGANTLKLTAANGYTGRTVVLGGVLQADFGTGLPATTNVTLNGGTLSTASGSLTLSLGSAPGQVNIVSNAPAGFSAYGAPLTVNLGGAAETLLWGAPSFSPNALLLNEVGADQPLTFINNLDLAGGARAITVNATAAGTGVTLAGNIVNSSGAGGLTKGGAGALTLAATNVYTGTTRVNGGTLRLDPASSNSLGEVQVANGSVLAIGSAALRQTTGNFVIYAGSANLSVGVVSNAAGYAYIGYNYGAATLAVNDGFFFTPNELNVGAWAGSTGYLNVSNGTVAARLLYVGRGGNGTVTQTGGYVKLAGAVGGDGWRIGGWSDTTAKGTGVYNLSGGELNSGGNNLQIGCSGSGTLRQTGGTTTCGGWPVVGRWGGGFGFYSLEGGVFNQTASGTGRQIIGENGNGTLTVIGSGVANLVGGLKLAAGSGGSGTVNLGAGGTINTPVVEKGSGPSATFNFDGGVLRARGSGATLPSFMQGLNTASVKAGGAVIDSSNNVITVAQNLQSGALPDGGLTKRGTGTLILSGTNSYNGVTTVEAGTLRLGNAAAVTNGGAVTVANGCYDLGGWSVTNGAVTLTSGAIINGTLSASAFAVSEGLVQASLGGSGELTKTGFGTVTISGTNHTYAGGTRVEGGTLRVSSLPEHRWSFNGNWKDSIGLVDATPVGAVSLDGTQCTLEGGAKGTSYVALAQNILPADQSPVTIELWATPHKVQNWSRIIDFGSGQNDYIIMCWSVGTDPNTDRVEVKQGGTSTYLNGTMSPYAIDTQVHLSFVITPGAGAGGTTLFQWYKMDAAGNTLKSGSMSAAFSMASLPQVNMWLGHSQWPDNDASASYNELRVWRGALSQAQLARNAVLGPDVLPTFGDNVLPADTLVSVAAGAALDLGGSSQTVNSLSGSGAVSNGTLAVTGVIAPGGTHAIGTLTLDASLALTGTLLADVALDGACDRLQVSGALDLRGLSLQVQDQGLLKPRQQYVIATCGPGGLTGPFEATNLDDSRWAVSYNNGSGEVLLVSRGLMVFLK